MLKELHLNRQSCALVAGEESLLVGISLVVARNVKLQYRRRLIAATLDQWRRQLGSNSDSKIGKIPRVFSTISDETIAGISVTAIDLHDTNDTSHWIIDRSQGQGFTFDADRGFTALSAIHLAATKTFEWPLKVFVTVSSE